MTRVSKRGPQKINDIHCLDKLQEVFLRSGHKYFPEAVFLSDRQMRQAWELHRKRLIAKWQSKKPGFVSYAEREFDGVQPAGTDCCDYH